MKRLQPAIGVAVLLVVIAIALRGHVPGVQPLPAKRPEPPPGDDPLAVTFVVCLLLASLVVVLLGLVARWRRRRTGPQSAAARPDWLREGERPSWRAGVIVFVAVIAALIAITWIGGSGGNDSTDLPAARTPDKATSAGPGSAPDEHVDRPPPPPDRDDGGHGLGFVYALTAILVAALVAMGVVEARARRAHAPEPSAADGDGPPPSDASTPLARAAELGLAEVEDPSREPRKAIIACYATMERELANVPDAMPQDFDTASEVLERAVEHHALSPGSATQLVELFDEARFSPHVMGEHHRDLAVEVLQRVLGELRTRA